MQTIIFIVLGILGILAAFAAPIMILRRRYSLQWAYLEPKSMLDIADEIVSHITISFQGSEIENVTQYQFILHNNGYVALSESAIVQPIEWSSPSRILSFRVVGTDPPVDVYLEEVNDCIQVTWPLLNQRCKALIEVLCEGNPREPQGRITGQIKNVPEIREKKVVLDDSQTTRSMVATGITCITLFVLIPITESFPAIQEVIKRWPSYAIPILVLGSFTVILTITTWAVYSFKQQYARFIKNVRISL